MWLNIVAVSVTILFLSHWVLSRLSQNATAAEDKK